MKLISRTVTLKAMPPLPARSKNLYRCHMSNDSLVESDGYFVCTYVICFLLDYFITVSI